MAFVGVVFIPRGIAEWLARVDCVRWTLAIGDWRFGPSKDLIYKKQGQGPLDGVVSNGGTSQFGLVRSDLSFCRFFQGKTKGQQLKGKIVS